MKLSIKATMLAVGIIFAALTLIFSVWYAITGFAGTAIAMLTDIYGNVVELSQDAKFINNLLDITLLTAFSFVDGGLIGLAFGFLYNLFVPKEKQESEQSGEGTNNEE